MNQRIKKLRKELNMTLEKFASMLGVGKAAISKIEHGTNNVSDQMISNICKTNWGGKFVLEEWLRTGEGDMFIEMPDKSELLQYIDAKPIDSLIKRMLKSYAELSLEEQAAVDKFINGMLNQKE